MANEEVEWFRVSSRIRSRKRQRRDRGTGGTTRFGDRKEG